ncbi:MAG TPA: glycerophosphodiester phosphodiesterase [Ktedonobacterales bacterium]|nr:glycerophosphodiester phosphodiesterase [Ktedonobacterales bacterium]
MTTDLTSTPSHVGPRPHRPYLTHARPLFFAHRGGSGVAPENTLEAFARGLSLGAAAIETDIQQTRDGAIVVMHDASVDRTTNGTGPVSGFTLDELRRLDAGYRFTPDGGQTFPFRGQGVTIPTLRAAFERFPDVRFNIDLKQSSPARERALWTLIQQLDARDRVLVASGEAHASIVRFRQLSAGQVATSASEREIRGFFGATLARATRWLHPAYDALQVPPSYRGIRVVSRPFVTAAHRLGLAVHVWTVDTAATTERLLALGVDGIMTDRPDLLAPVFAARQ